MILVIARWTPEAITTATTDGGLIVGVLATSSI
jgi:hypothetical protein